jgi:Helix-turn-helix domain
MASGPRQKKVREYRGQIPSPGRPTVAWREDRVRFWAAIARGVMTEDAAAEAGVSAPVAFRWFRHAGGVNPALAATVSGRYLFFAEREDIAIWHAQKVSGREIARRLGRDPSTICRELRRNASTRTYRLDYKASIAQWHAERRARRPKVAKLVADDRLRQYVQDRLSGLIRTPDGTREVGRRGQNGRVGTSRTAVTAGGSPPGARSRSRTACPSSSLTMSPCGSRMRPSTRRCSFRAVVRCSANWSPACEPGERYAFPGLGHGRRLGRMSRLTC